MVSAVAGSSINRAVAQEGEGGKRKGRNHSVLVQLAWHVIGRFSICIFHLVK